MNVLIIPEDFRKDQFILKPLFSGLFRAIGKPRARVVVCQEPLLGGIGGAMKAERIQKVVEKHEGMTDIFILCVDRDGDTNRRQHLNVLEEEFGTGRTFFAENAWEELETWLLAGMDLPNDWSWQDVRAEISVKEKYFNPLAEQRDVANTPGEGRKVLGEEAARKIPTIRKKCSEDFDALAQRLDTFINN
ncbi:MAG: hypothetical protein F4201_08890 [Nitrospira sp. SB0677_bin_15]|nr:hypothetical protein [Nitrospira sp. SB0667_bin_9]MYD30629.1 hypothetical protein [Nitrospira sp. SB0661_bin_20]MYG40911.1 hypothetical protein [Nitrospira sp. SB0677_bin_15]MYJ22344.1 hypothetical protein [Nitrospira sp. SB0673_bin_12]